MDTAGCRFPNSRVERCASNIQQGYSTPKQPMASLFARFSPPHFRPERDMPDLSGKIALVTGGNTGIGYETVEQLLLKNAKVYLAARSGQKANAAIERLEAETKKRAILLQLDLADLRSVRKAAEAFLAQESRLDLLFNNGGVMISPPEMLTAQGHDLQFGTNCIGHFFLTELLLPALLQSHADTGTRARVMHTSSIGHTFAPGRGIEFESLKGGEERDEWVKSAGGTMGPWRLYGESKLGNILVSNYFAREYGDKIVSSALHPGSIRSELNRHASALLQIISNTFFKFPAPMGAYTQLWGATVADADSINGQYLIPWGKIGKTDPRAGDRALEDEVIAHVKEQVKEF
ncbi:Short-chain dehydrogenase/reductase family protein [Mycena sanguinolenta]|uniref:Short-chain dehydrogenase/reductase family protein n=1 Tax=Mycena sanguinolenta TaxID=230812 RepID=A0A8H6XMV7_9AGAR|nr:Short-chain dehydrogenase/reductase family protein [Mycena sanguinolenta]